MADETLKDSKSNASMDGADSDNSSFAWEFVNDEARDQSPSATPRVYAGSPTGLSQPMSGGQASGEAATSAYPSTSRRKGMATATLNRTQAGTVRDSYVRDQLERALDRWWALGEVPPLPLLRDGLLMLEAGGHASESQRTLLLRAALAHGRGVRTALRYQVDNERVAMVLAEALVEWEPPLDPKNLVTILGEDAPVRVLLAADLERSRALLTGEARRRAEVALEMLPSSQSSGRSSPPSPPASPLILLTPGRKLVRQILLLLLLVTLIGFILWQQRQVTPAEMVAMPAAEYALLGASDDEPVGSVRLNAFFLDRFEVTNALYRSCVDIGKCVWPKSANSATRADYFTNPAFNDFPVVNVTQEMASAFCAWHGKRLPTAEEWQAAASVSPTTGQAFRYPWGESFDSQRTNSLEAAIGDTVVAGSYRPGGDSASGAADMAGNVAEWTSSLVVNPPTADSAIIKGGSFAGNSDALTVGAKESLAINKGSPEVGFRCARTHLLNE
jgi:formylglycine-generating enzyme required for sulfatase activity